jgi:hypothetical protein
MHVHDATREHENPHTMGCFQIRLPGSSSQKENGGPLASLRVEIRVPNVLHAAPPPSPRVFALYASDGASLSILLHVFTLFTAPCDSSINRSRILQGKGSVAFPISNHTVTYGHRVVFPTCAIISSAPNPQRADEPCLYKDFSGYVFSVLGFSSLISFWFHRTWPNIRASVLGFWL